MTDRVENTQARVGAIARQQNDFDMLMLSDSRIVKPQQFTRQFKGHARLQQLVFMQDLMLLIGLNAARFVYGVTFRQVEQRSRRNRDDQTVINVSSQRNSYFGFCADTM